MVSDAQKKANIKYKSANVKQVSIKFFPKDHDVFEYLKSKEGKNGYIIDLIRKDMSNSI